MTRRFLCGPLIATVVLTAAWLVAETFDAQVVTRLLWFVSAPAVVASSQSLSFIERYMHPIYPALLAHYAVVSGTVYFATTLCWTAFLSLPYWSRFRVGSMSFLATEGIIVIVAVLLTLLAYAYMFATFPSTTSNTPNQIAARNSRGRLSLVASGFSVAPLTFVAGAHPAVRELGLGV